MRIQGKRLTGLRVAQPVEDQILIEACVFRSCHGRIQLTGERLIGTVSIAVLVDWAAREGFLSWTDNRDARGELQELRR